MVKIKKGCGLTVKPHPFFAEEWKDVPSFKFQGADGSKD
jgi:hypothetical protein